MFFGSGTTRCDDGYGDAFSQCGKGFVGETGLHTVMIHAGEEDFSRTSFAYLVCPVEQLAVCGHASAVQVASPSVFILMGVNGDYAHLAAEVAGYFVNQFRPFQCGTVDAHLVGSGR